MTIEETEALLEQFQCICPEDSPELNEGRKGVGAVLCYLAHQTEPVPSVSISKATGVSTARMAVLLKKLEEKGLIERTEDPSDARKRNVVLTQEGQKQLEEQNRMFVSFMSKVIENMGKERFCEFIQLANEYYDSVRRTLKNPTNQDYSGENAYDQTI